MGISGKGYIDPNLEKAVEKLKAKGRYGHVHSDRCMREICHVLGSDEETILEIRQSHLRNITPERFIATNKRLIIVRPSFFGHYLGFDLVTHTEISFVPYNQIISIVMSRGKVLSTIHMRIHGYTDVSTSPLRNEGEVEGIRTKQATRFTIFIEDIIESKNGREGSLKEKPTLNRRIVENKDYEKGVDLNEARDMVHRGAKLVWLGVEPVIEFAAALGVGVDSVMRFNAGTAPEFSRDELLRYRNCIFVSYTGVMSKHVVKYLKREHDIDAFSLNYGVLEIAESRLENLI